MPRQSRLSDPVYKAQLKSLKEQGLGVNQIARIMGIGHSTISANLVKLGYGTRSGVIRKHLDELMQMLDMGYTYHQIAERFGVHEQSVASFCRRTGYKRKWESIPGLETKYARETLKADNRPSVDDAHFVRSKNGDHSVVIHWREYYRLKELAGEL